MANVLSNKINYQWMIYNERMTENMAHTLNQENIQYDGHSSEKAEMCNKWR